MVPSRHMFAVRDHLKMELADEAICDKRWTRKYYYKTQRMFNENEPQEATPLMITSAVKTRRILSQHEKYRKAALMTRDIAGLASEATGQLYIQRMEVLAEIKKAWQENREIFVTRTDTGKPVAQSIRSSEDDKEGGTDDSASVEYPCEASTSTANNLPKIVSTQNHKEKSVRTPPPNVVQSDSDSDCANEQHISKSPPHTTQDLTKIKVPPAQKRRGRPRGAEKTTIGLPKRVGVKTTMQTFCKKRESEKVLIMLKWFVDRDVAESATSRGIIISESQVETRPDQVSQAILDDDVNIPLIKRFFSKDAWQVVQNVLKMKKRSDRWDCGICRADLDTTIAQENSSPNTSTKDQVKTSIRCDYCLEWYHLPCIPLKTAPKTKSWMCLRCRQEKRDI